MQWLFGSSAAAAPAAPAAAADAAPPRAPGAGMALDVLTVREGESLDSAKAASGNIVKGTVVRVIELRGRRALVCTGEGHMGWVSVRQPDGTLLVGETKSEPPPVPPAPPQQRKVDGAALAARVVAAYDDNEDGSLNYAEMCSHEADLGRPPPSEDQYKRTCAERVLDPAQGLPAAFLSELLCRVTEEQERSLCAALTAREAEVAAFAAAFAAPAFLTGFLQQEVAGYISTGPVQRWVRLDGGTLHLSDSPTAAASLSLPITPATRVEENVDGGKCTLRVAGTAGDETLVFGGHSSAEHRLWGHSLSLAVAQTGPRRRLPRQARERFALLLNAVPAMVPALTASLPEAAQAARLHGYMITCTYWSMLGPNWKRRYVTLHRGWAAIRDDKKDPAGLVVMPLRNAVAEPDPNQPHAFSINGIGFPPVTLWCDGDDECRRWRLAFETEIARARGEHRVNWAMVKKGDAACSNALCVALAGDAGFDALAATEAKALVDRDREDDVKLQKGIDFSISRGVLKRIPPPKVQVVDVAGKSVDDVAQIITKRLPQDKGCVVVLQGMSGTGKSTTTKRLLSLLPRSAGWSNGNVFRSITLLAATFCEQNGKALKEHSEEVLTPENIARWVGMLTFEKTGEGYTIRIRGMGYDFTVDEIATTLLQEPRVAHSIPTVAEKTQGEVIQFAAAALKQMAADGKNVVLEGRAPTVQYVPTPHRFELVLRDTELLGRRRAAQRCVGALQQKFAADATAPAEAALLTAAAGFCAAQRGAG